MPTIQWFPGHMAKTTRLIKESLKRVDVVVEVLDARAPVASENPLLRQITQSKPRLVILNKDDLADPSATRLWAERFAKEGQTLPICVSAMNYKGIDAVQQKSRELCGHAPWLARRPVRGLIAGIPNVGKSTIINALSRRRSAEAGATPGLTRDLRRIPVSRQFELFDTPGLLWHKFDDTRTGLILAALGSVKETVLPEEDVTAGVLSYMASRYPAALSARYGLDEMTDDGYAMVEGVGRKRGCILAGGRVDLLRVCQMVLKDLREGRFGRVSLEWPDGEGWD